MKDIPILLRRTNRGDDPQARPRSRHRKVGPRRGGGGDLRDLLALGDRAGQIAGRGSGRAPDLKDFAAILPNWTREDALRIERSEMSAEKMDFDVTRCRYAEMYREMGLGDIGHLLSCNRDGDFCRGYNPEIELTRTRTIMKGASNSDFRHRMKKES